jgi:hypothetical protein
MSINVGNGPGDEPFYHVFLADFKSGQVNGAPMPDYRINTKQLGFVDDQHGKAIGWRLANNKPHGELQVYENGVEFIPLYVLEGYDYIKGKSADGTFENVKGIAFWIETENAKAK